MVTYQWQARQHCCPPPQSAETHPGLRGPTCPSDPSAPACPRSPPWMTCFLLALYTTWNSEILASHKTDVFRGRKQGAESRKTSFFLLLLLFLSLPSRSKWAHSSWMHLKWVSLCNSLFTVWSKALQQIMDWQYMKVKSNIYSIIKKGLLNTCMSICT